MLLSSLEPARPTQPHDSELWQHHDPAAGKAYQQYSSPTWYHSSMHMACACWCWCWCHGAYCRSPPSKHKRELRHTRQCYHYTIHSHACIVPCLHGMQVLPIVQCCAVAQARWQICGWQRPQASSTPFIHMMRAQNTCATAACFVHGHMQALEGAFV